jgi:hypothetical protein
LSNSGQDAGALGITAELMVNQATSVTDVATNPHTFIPTLVMHWMNTTVTTVDAKWTVTPKGISVCLSIRAVVVRTKFTITTGACRA